MWTNCCSESEEDLRSNPHSNRDRFHVRLKLEASNITINETVIILIVIIAKIIYKNFFINRTGNVSNKKRGKILIKILYKSSWGLKHIDWLVSFDFYQWFGHDMARREIRTKIAQFQNSIEFLAKNNTLVMPQPPYSPDLALVTFSCSRNWRGPWKDNATLRLRR